MARSPEAPKPKEGYWEQEVSHDEAYPPGEDRPYSVARADKEEEDK
jgi:hypothetical protein